MMTIDEMKEYLLDELKTEYVKMTMNQENKYSYIFMLCNDMGITLENQAEQEAETMKAKAEAEANKNQCLQQELEAAKAEIMRVKAHAYDLMMEREAL